MLQLWRDSVGQFQNWWEPRSGLGNSQSGNAVKFQGQGRV